MQNIAAQLPRPLANFHTMTLNRILFQVTPAVRILKLFGVSFDVVKLPLRRL